MNTYKPLRFKYFEYDLIQCEPVVNYTQFNNAIHTRRNNNTNKHYINNKILIKLLIRTEFLINSEQITLKSYLQISQNS